MTESSSDNNRPGFAKRLFRAVGQAGSAAGRAVGQAGSAAGRAVGQAGSAVGEVAGDIIRSAGQTAKSAGGRALLTFAGEVAQTPPQELRELAESLAQWLVEENQGSAELQHQKPSTVELTEFGESACYYEVVLEEPGLMGRRMRFIFRTEPLPNYAANLPPSEQKFTSQAVIVLRWNKRLLEEPEEQSFLVWDQAVALGDRGAAQDLGQRWVKSELEGTFPQRKLASFLPPGKSRKKLPIFGREEQLEEAELALLTPTYREEKRLGVLAIAAPGGTGKSYFLKALEERLGRRVFWSCVDHQGLVEGAEGVDVLAKILSALALGLEEYGIEFDSFSKEYRAFRRRREKEGEGEPSGFLSHLRKAAETAAGINPVIGAASAGVTFFTSWAQEVKDVSEALAKDDTLKVLTSAFTEDLAKWSQEMAEDYLLFARPVLVLDTYEWLAPLVDIWVRTELVSDQFFESTGAVLILAGRDHLLRTDTRWSEWQHLTHSITLKPFDLETSRAYLESLSADPDRAEELYELTEGSPLFLSLVAQLEEPDQAISILSERILEEVSVEHRDAFRKAALADNFDNATLSKLFPELDDEAKADILKRLKRATFTVAQKGKRCFLPSVRKLLRSSLLLELGEDELEEFQQRLKKS